MIKKTLFTCLSMLAIAIAAQAQAQAVPFRPVAPDGPLIAFIGEKISIEPFPSTPAELAAERADDERAKAKGSEIVRIQFTSRLKAKYRVLKVVAGDMDKDSIEFVTTHHVGAIPYAQQDPVLLFVRAGVGKWDGMYIHQRGPFAFVQQTRDGRWVACNDGRGMFYFKEPDLMRQLHPVDLACEQGLTAEELAAFVIGKAVKAPSTP